MYRALYRKWRPMCFEDVVGQQAIVTALQNQISAGRVGHAYMFTGTRGTGKTTCAKIFAKAVNCPHAEHGDPCGECSVCKGIDSGSILDVVEIDAASNNGVDNIRDLREETSYTPSVCKYRVYIIDEVHMLSIAAFNALLKIMEEPPSHVIFILATTEIHKVPATILSRCQRYDFGRIRPEDIAERIQYIAGQEEIELTEGAAALIARLADGALRDALSILDTCAGVSQQVDEELVRRMAGVTDKSYLFRLSDSLQAGDAVAALEELAELRQRSVDVKRLCEELVGHYRNLMLAGLPSGKGLLAGIAPEEEELYLQKARQIPMGAAVRAIKLLGGAMEKMNRGTDQRIELELAMFAITEPPAAAGQGTRPQQEVQKTVGFEAAAPAQNVPFAQASNMPLQQAVVPFAKQNSDDSKNNSNRSSEPVTTQGPENSQNPAPETLKSEKPLQGKTPEKADDIEMMQPPVPVPDDRPIQADPEDLPPWEMEPVEMKEVSEPSPQPVPEPEPKAVQKLISAVPSASKGALLEFEAWPQVLTLLEHQFPLMYSFLKTSHAYDDGRRVLIESGTSFREYIRTNKEAQHNLKELIEKACGIHRGIGPYEPPAEQQRENQQQGPTLEETVEKYQAMGVEIVDKPDD